MANGNQFTQGGITPVFNEVSILLAFSPRRPMPDETLEDIAKYAFCERVLMQAPTNKATGFIEPTLFHRSDTFIDPSTGFRSQRLTLANDAPYGVSKIFGGEVGMNVLPPLEIPELAKTGLSVDAASAMLTGRFGRAVLPRQASVGMIQALQHDSDFPARVVVPVYYSFVSGGSTGKLDDESTNLSIEAKEPHTMEAVVNSVPPDPQTPVCANEWNLVDSCTYGSIWVKVECFRFLAPGNWQRKTRLTFKNNAVVEEA